MYMNHMFPEEVYKIVREKEKEAFQKHRLNYELRITPYSLFPYFFIKDSKNPRKYGDLFCLSHLLSQQMFLLDNFLDEQQPVSSDLLKCFHCLSVINRDLSIKFGSSVYEQLENSLDRTFSVAKKEEIYRKNELNIDSVTIHPLNDQEYHTFVIDKVASWEIVPYIVGIIDEVSSNQWIRTLQKMALVNQMFDDIIDWKDDLHKHHWTHWTQHLASIYSVRDPSILIQTLKKDESFIQLIGDSLSRLLTTSTTICEDLETQGLYQLSDWWTRSKLTTINKINKKITSNK